MEKPSPNNSDFTVLVYRDSASPRILKFKAVTLKQFLIGIPFLFALIILTGFGVILYRSSSIRNLANRFELNSLNEEIGILNAENLSLKLKIKALMAQPKSTQSESESQSEPDSEEKPTNHQSILTTFPKNQLIVASGFSGRFSSKSKQLSFRFQLQNNAEETKKPFEGTLIVMAVLNGKVYIYPKESIATKGLLINPSHGESFKFMNLRPVEALFQLDEVPSGTVLFKVFLYDQSGNPLFFEDWAGNLTIN